MGPWFFYLRTGRSRKVVACTLIFFLLRVLMTEWKLKKMPNVDSVKVAVRVRPFSQVSSYLLWILFNLSSNIDNLKEERGSWVGSRRVLAIFFNAHCMDMHWAAKKREQKIKLQEWGVGVGNTTSNLNMFCVSCAQKCNVFGFLIKQLAVMLVKIV